MSTVPTKLEKLRSQEAAKLDNCCCHVGARGEAVVGAVLHAAKLERRCRQLGDKLKWRSQVTVNVETSFSTVSAKLEPSYS